MQIQRAGRLGLLLLIALGISSCGFFGPELPRRQAVTACAEPRLQTSLDYHGKAKEFLASYYKTRKEAELFFAWYATEDSNYMARTIRGCWDKRNKHYHAVQNMVSRNTIIRRLISQNLRPESQTQLSELFLDDYRKIFTRDIQ